jgi:hypothetical protein
VSCVKNCLTAFHTRMTCFMPEPSELGRGVAAFQSQGAMPHFACLCAQHARTRFAQLVVSIKMTIEPSYRYSKAIVQGFLRGVAGAL